MHCIKDTFHEEGFHGSEFIAITRAHKIRICWVVETPDCLPNK